MTTVPAKAHTSDAPIFHCLLRDRSQEMGIGDVRFISSQKGKINSKLRATAVVATY